jgi:uncharacterized UPF0160 family protein
MKLSLGTHNGTFHADEVTAVAMLQIIHPTLKVIRTRDPKLLANCEFVVDVGSVYDTETDRYDHHQKSFTDTRPTGVPYASAGLIWLNYGTDIVSSIVDKLDLVPSIVDTIDCKYIEPIDNIDNGLVRPKEGEYHFSQYISSFNHEDINDELIQDSKFNESVNVVRSWLFSIITKEYQVAKDLVEVQQIMDFTSNGILILPRYLPWQDLVLPFNESAPIEDRFTHVIFPSADGYRVQATNESYYLPLHWRGADNLAEISDLPSAIFCHKAGFIAGFGTLRDALLAATFKDQASTTLRI